MDPVLRARVVNALVLACVLALYVAYDVGFRLWVARSDIQLFTATLSHDIAALPPNLEMGFAYDAAASTLPTPALQTYVLHHQQLATPPSASSHTKANVETSSTGDTIATAAAPGYHAHVSAALPMAAVVVESTWLSPDQDEVSHPYAQRLLEGYRYGLLSGAPWVLLSGSAVESSVGLQFLRLLPDPAEALFPETTLRRWPPSLVATALQLRHSMTPYATLGEWMHGVDTAPLASFPLPSFALRPSTLQSWGASGATNPLPLQASLEQLLSSHELAEAEGAHVRQAALLLGAEWLQHMDARISAYSRSEMDGEGEVPSRASPASTHGEGVKVRRWSHVTVHTRAAGGDETDAAGEAERRSARSDNSFPPSSSLSRAPHHPKTLQEGDAPANAAAAAPATPWDQPRVREMRINSSSALVHVMIPALVMVTEEDVNKRVRVTARALQQLVEKAAVQRHTIAHASLRHGDQPSEEEGWWWWLGRSYGVAVVAGGWKQHRVKLLYLKALRDAVVDSQEGLRRAVRQLHQSRCQFEVTPPPLYCRGHRRTSLSSSALPFHTAVPAPPRVFVLPPPPEELQGAAPPPKWLRYTGELPLSIHPEASQAALLVGRVSFFIYVNYRRWMDWFLASLSLGSFQDHFVLISLLMSDFAEHRISWQDILYSR